MPKNDIGADKAATKRGLLLVAVGVGIALFVTGFVIAVTSLSEPEGVSASDDRAVPTEDARGSSLSLMFGLLVSLSGVVLATTTPAVLFIKGQKG